LAGPQLPGRLCEFCEQGWVTRAAAPDRLRPAVRAASHPSRDANSLLGLAARIGQRGRGKLAAGYSNNMAKRLFARADRGFQRPPEPLLSWGVCTGSMEDYAAPDL